MLPVRSHKERRRLHLGIRRLVRHEDHDLAHIRRRRRLDRLHPPDAVRVIPPQRLQKRIHRIHRRRSRRKELRIHRRKRIGLRRLPHIVQLQRSRRLLCRRRRSLCRWSLCCRRSRSCLCSRLSPCHCRNTESRRQSCQHPIRNLQRIHPPPPLSACSTPITPEP